MFQDNCGDGIERWCPCQDFKHNLEFQSQLENWDLTPGRVKLESVHAYGVENSMEDIPDDMKVQNPS